MRFFLLFFWPCCLFCHCFIFIVVIVFSFLVVVDFNLGDCIFLNIDVDDDNGHTIVMEVQCSSSSLPFIEKSIYTDHSMH